MKCPHCFQSIRWFSEELSEVGKTNSCVHCGKRVKVGIIHGRFILGFLPVALLAILLGISSALAAGIAGGVGTLVGLGLKSDEA